MEGLLVPLDDDWGDGSAGTAAYPALGAPGKAQKKRAASKHETKRREKAAQELQRLASGTIVLGKPPPAARAEGGSKKRAAPAEEASAQGAAKKQKAARKQPGQAPALGAQPKQAAEAAGAAAAAEPKRKGSKQRRRGAEQLTPTGGAGGEVVGAVPAPAAERTDHDRHGKKQKKRKLKPAPPAPPVDQQEMAAAAAPSDDAAGREPSHIQAATQKHPAARLEAAAAAKPDRKKAAKKGKQAKVEVEHEDADAADEELEAEGASDRQPGEQPGLLEKMAARLSGSKFRWLNEALYTTTGDKAFELMQEQPSLFEQYHTGFQQQTKAWPQQPVDAAVAWLKQQPASLRVADFGCGDAALALAVPQRVACLDLVATRPGVIACNMADTPLETGSMDVAVFCLALMGTDYPAFLAEAARVLRPGGRLWIAEVRSRFAASGGREDFRPFLAALAGLGFAHEATDASNRMFVVFRMRKQKQAGSGGSSSWPELKPCLYKRR